MPTAISRYSLAPGKARLRCRAGGTGPNSRARDFITVVHTWVADGATSEEHAAALLKNRLYCRWGIKTAREYARIKIDGLRLVGGNPDSTNAPGHGDDDARFYDRQQAYVHARGG